MFLIVQTAQEMLYVPGDEVATLMPAYPNRWRVVLSDGRVGHRQGQLPEGPWVRLGAGWVSPRCLRREGDYWVDPAGFRYHHEPLAEPPGDELEDEQLPLGLLSVERRGREWWWRTDFGDSASGLNVHQLRELFADLVEVGQNRFVYFHRVRSFGAGFGGGWLKLDQAELIKLNGKTFAPKVAGYLGLESLSTQDTSVPWKLWRLREYPFDLATADPDLIRSQLPDAKIFAEQLMWQTVLRSERGESLGFGSEPMSFFDYLVEAGKRCGYEYPRSRWARLRMAMVLDQGVVRLRQLGQREWQPGLRQLGTCRPDLVLLAPAKYKAQATQAARSAGISLLLVAREYHMPLECLASELRGPLQLLVWDLPAPLVAEIKRRFVLWDLECYGRPVWLQGIGQLAQEVASRPLSPDPAQVEPFRRIALQCYQGLYFAQAAEIAAWKPSPPDRWQVELLDGTLLHHPGPVPKQVCPPALLVGGPQLPCSPERILWLEETGDTVVWHLDDGRAEVSSLSYAEARAQHPGLLPISRHISLNYNRIRRSYPRNRPILELDSGQQFPLPLAGNLQRLRQRLNLHSLRELSRDTRGLRHLELRDLGYEIVAARADRLRADFSGVVPLMANIVWQVYCGLYQYGQSFSGFFYFPLQAVLYRAGYLTRAQLRAEWRSHSAKDRLYRKYCDCVTSMVRDYKLFNYRELGFVDEFPQKRILGDRQPQRILLVEKGDRLEEYARQFQRESGVSLLILQGMPSLLASEYFAAALREVWVGAVEVYFYGDYDFAGWDMGPAFIRQLQFYGVECSRFERVVLASVFTPEEQSLCSRPLEPSSVQQEGWVRRFVRESGGVQGQARGIHANWLQPYGRFAERMLELLT